MFCIPLQPERMNLLGERAEIILRAEIHGRVQDMTIHLEMSTPSVIRSGRKCGT